MANPLAAMQAFLNANAAALPAGTTYSTSFPTSAIAKPHVQFAWDGTPSDADNREDVAVRFTVWTPAGQHSLASDVAATLRTLVLGYSSADVQRVGRGAGRAPGDDPDTGLPFCTFTVNPVMHAITA